MRFSNRIRLLCRSGSHLGKKAEVAFTSGRLLIVLAGLVFTSLSSSADARYSNESASAAGVSAKSEPMHKLKFVRKISFGGILGKSSIAKITFSPDEHYIAIVEDINPAMSKIIVYDLLENQEISTIETSAPYGSRPQVELLWSPNSKLITLGVGGAREGDILFWDPLSGGVAKRLPIDRHAHWSRYNRSGDKLLVFTENTGTDGEPAYRIYDTKSWKFEEYGDDYLGISTMSWTSEDKLLVAGSWARRNEGRLIDGKIPKRLDILIRLVDPNARGEEASSILIPSIGGDNNNEETRNFPIQNFPSQSMIVNSESNKALIRPSIIVDARKLKIDDLSENNGLSEFIKRGQDIAFSKDGNRLYYLTRKFNSTKESVVINTKTSEIVATFPAGVRGIASSPDGKLIAIGNGAHVEFYDAN